MLHITHSLHSRQVDEYARREHAAFLITNKKGNFLSLGDNNFTHMQGMFFFDHKKWEAYKTLENIKLDSEVSGIKNNFYEVRRTYKEGAEETFNLFSNSMLYSVNNYEGDLLLELDFRAMFDYSDQGRIYSIEQEDGAIIIRYDKYSDNSLTNIERTGFLVIRGAHGFENVDRWARREYEYDRRRNSKSEFYIYQALKIPVNKHLSLVFSYSRSRQEALIQSLMVEKNRNYYLNSLKNYMEHTFTSNDIALDAALKALDDVTISTELSGRSVGILAGLPWFHQFWSRDELISLKALIFQERHYLVKSILFKYLDSIREDGLLPNIIPGEGLRSIDSVGWLFLRIKDYIDSLSQKKMLESYLSPSEFIIIKEKLERTILKLSHFHTREGMPDGLIVSNAQETWMDSRPADRAGACIEIQALFLAMLGLHNQISKLTRSDPVFKTHEKEQKEIVRKAFLKDGVISDSIGNGFSDTRPNIFLACYIYPDLFSKKEWSVAFDSALSDLWLPWGGLASISQKSERFSADYTGENDRSYHNGDSWFYVNNLAAIAMNRIDKKKYSEKIKKIYLASKEEMLFSGFVGCASELSSAKALGSEGCLSQSWSNATFVELWNEIGPSK